MSKQARDATGIKDLEVIADRGYYNMEEIKATVDEGITPYVPKSLTSNNKKKGLYDRRDFIYIEADDEYRCLAGERLIRRMVTLDGNKNMVVTGVQTAGSADSSRSAHRVNRDG